MSSTPYFFTMSKLKKDLHDISRRSKINISNISFITFTKVESKLIYANSNRIAPFSLRRMKPGLRMRTPLRLYSNKPYSLEIPSDIVYVRKTSIYTPGKI